MQINLNKKNYLPTENESYNSENMDNVLEIKQINNLHKLSGKIQVNEKTGKIESFPNQDTKPDLSDLIIESKNKSTKGNSTINSKMLELKTQQRGKSLSTNRSKKSIMNSEGSIISTNFDKCKIKCFNIFIVKTLENLIIEIRAEGFDKIQSEINENIPLKGELELNVDRLEAELKKIKEEIKETDDNFNKLLSDTVKLKQNEEV